MGYNWRFSKLNSTLSNRNNLIKFTHYDETKTMNYDLQIVRAKENLKLSHGGSSLGQASDTNPSMKVLCQGRH